MISGVYTRLIVVSRFQQLLWLFIQLIVGKNNTSHLYWRIVFLQKLSSSKPFGTYLLEGKINIPYYHGEDQIDNTFLIIHHFDNQGLNYNSEMFQVYHALQTW